VGLWCGGLVPVPGAGWGNRSPFPKRSGKEGDAAEHPFTMDDIYTTKFPTISILKTICRIYIIVEPI